MPRTRIQDRSQFQNYRNISVANPNSEKTVNDLKGLNTVLPDDLQEDGASPFLKNARYYAEDNEDSRVAISTRKGTKNLSVPIGETVDDQQTSTTGAANQAFGTAAWLADVFSPAATGRLTKVDINLKTNTGTGPVIIEIRKDDSGSPGDVLAKSSVLTSDIGSTYAYKTARFIAAPLLTTGVNYWIVVHLQDNGTGSHHASSTTSVTTAKASANSGTSWSATTYGLNFKTYFSTNSPPKGFWRRINSTGAKESILFHGTSAYSINEATGVTTAIKTDFNAGAEEYSVAQLDDKEWIANGADYLTYYDGTTFTRATGYSGIPKLIVAHKNRLFAVSTNDPTRVDWNEIPPNTNQWLSTGFFHAPAPKTGDPITGMIPFQDNLVVFTRANKYILSGSDPATFSLRQSLESHGAVNQKCIATDNRYVYYVSDDGCYRFNGSVDERISDSIVNYFLNMGNKEAVCGAVFDRKYRLYYPTTGGTNNEMLLWDTVHEDWFHDTNKPVSFAFTQAQEPDKLYEVSSLVGQVFLGEQGGSDLGAPIDFEYRTKYFTFGSSVSKKQARRFYPNIRGQQEPFNAIIQIDKDYENSPTDNTYALQASGDTWGGGDSWGSTFTYGYNPLKYIRIPSGTARYFQARFKREGVDNQMEIINYTWFYQRREAR